MAKVYAPNEAYMGVSASVVFVGGVGECADPALLEWFLSHGYTVEEPGEGKPLEKMNKSELLAEAAERNLTVPDGATKETLLQLLKTEA